MKVPFFNLEFFFEGNAVGIFKKFKYPTKDCECQYEPYRGFGHLKMLGAIEEKSFAICFYTNGKEKVFFKVENSNKHKRIILSEFRKEIIQN